MRADSDIRRDAEAELRCCPKINKTDVAVKVKDGIVTLTGFARSYLARQRAEAAVHHMTGVRGIINSIQIESLVARLEIKRPYAWGHGAIAGSQRS